jgi:hypothetical protein
MSQLDFVKYFKPQFPGFDTALSNIQKLIFDTFFYNYLLQRHCSTPLKNSTRSILSSGMTSCSLVEGYRRFGEVYCLYARHLVASF